MSKVSNYMRTRIELLHKQAHDLAGIFKSSKSRGLLVTLASISRSWIIKELQITGFVANLLCLGRPAKLSVHAKSIYRSTDAKKWWQTFLVKKLFFRQKSQKHEDSTFSMIYLLITRIVMFLFFLYSMYCIIDHCFYFIRWLLKEPFVLLFVWFICLFPRCVYVGAGFQQPLGWPYVGLVFIPQVCRSRYLHLWILLSFLSETRRICRA